MTDRYERIRAALAMSPTPSNRAKLQAYLQKHMMAVCMATEQEIAFLNAHEFKL